MLTYTGASLAQAASMATSQMGRRALLILEGEGISPFTRWLSCFVGLAIPPFHITASPQADAFPQAPR